MDSRPGMHILSSPDQAFSAEGDSIWGSSSRVLQDSSGNVGLEATSAFLKSEEDAGSETKEAPSIFESRRKTRYKDGKRQAARRSHRRRPKPWEIDRNFVRYELQSERYRAYRAKAVQSNEQKWPEDVEVCLQYALRIIPCLGRKKEIREDFNGAPGGRNELIRDYILKWTGQFRDRKQVSSHLQVLRGLLSDNKSWMEYVTKLDENQPVYRPSYLGENGGEYGYRHDSYSTALPPPSGILGSNVPSVHQVGFEMSVDNQSGERYHTYTRIQSEIGSSQRLLEEIAGWQELYPRLASYFRQGHLDSELILLEANFDLLREYPPRGSQLRVKPFILVNGGTKYSNWQSSTHMYERGIQVSEKRRDILLDNGLLDLEGTNLGLTNVTKVIPRINCSWWAKNVFGEILGNIREARAQGDGYAIQQAEERGRLVLAEMSMMQEVWATPEIDGSSPRRIAILLWKFRQTRDNEAATTTWRRLTPPCPWDKTHSAAQSPKPLVLEPLTAIDTSLQDTVLVQQAFVYADQSRKNSLFVDDPESIITGQPSDMDSTLSTPTPDLRSLPSSTASSFASSIFGSMHPLHAMQESSFCSQDSAAYSFDGDIHSQETHHSAHDSGYHSQDTGHIAPDLEYLPQEPYYPDPSHTYPQQDCEPNEVICQHDVEYMQHEAPSILARQRSTYDHTEPHDAQHLRATDVTQSFARRLSYHSQNDPYQVDLPAFAEASPQDFEGGQIHISFADKLQQHHDYDQIPLAPPANMLSHHDSFDSQYEEPYQEVYQHDSQEMEIGPHDELQHDDEQSLLIHEHHSLEPRLPTEPPLDHPSPPVHHGSTTSLTLHHPQPHPSLQHHIDSVRWTTHALWAATDPQSQGSSEDHDLVDETLKIEPTHEQIVEGIPEIEGLDDEQGRILSEVSERLERELEQEREREIERQQERELELELERELGKGMKME